jgi:hypothetical protein
MRPKQIISFLLISCVSAFLNNCSGANQLTLLNAAANTNPALEYANPYTMSGNGGFLFHRNTIPGQLGNAESKLRGEACSHSVLYLVSWGDSSIETAKKNGKITKIASTEFENLGIFAVLYHGSCTIVTGSGDDSAPADPAASVEVKQPAKRGK